MAVSARPVAERIAAAAADQNSLELWDPHGPSVVMEMPFALPGASKRSRTSREELRAGFSAVGPGRFEEAHDVVIHEASNPEGGDPRVRPSWLDGDDRVSIRPSLHHGDDGPRRSYRPLARLLRPDCRGEDHRNAPSARRRSGWPPVLNHSSRPLRRKHAWVLPKSHLPWRPA